MTGIRASSLRGCVYCSSRGGTALAHVRSLFFDGPLAEVENKALNAYKLGRPSEIIWNITNRCNLLCDHCYMAADGHALPDQLTDEEAIDLVRQMGEAGVPVVFLSGGEPMVRRNFWEILETCTLLRHARDDLHERDAHRPRRRQAPQGERRRLDRHLDVRPRRVPRRDGRRARHASGVIEAVKVLREEGIGVALKTRGLARTRWPYIYDIIRWPRNSTAA